MIRMTSRNEAIVEAYTAGRAVKEISEEFGVTRQRVYQILDKAGVERTAVGEVSRERKKQKKDELTARIVATYEELGTVSGTISAFRGSCSAKIVREVLGPRPHPKTRRPGGQRRWSDADILERMRAADAAGASTRSAYEEWRAVTAGDAPSWALITMRFGSWSNARRVAGLQVRESVAGAKRRFDEKEVLTSIGRFLVASEQMGVYPSSSAYEKWASMSSDLPSLSTVRMRTNMTWNDLVNKARPR